MTQAAGLLDTERFDIASSSDDLTSAVAIDGVFNITQGPMSDPAQNWITLDRDGASRLRDALGAALDGSVSAALP
jgi:hypothetical protein